MFFARCNSRCALYEFAKLLFQAENQDLSFLRFLSCYRPSLQPSLYLYDTLSDDQDVNHRDALKLASNWKLFHSISMHLYDQTAS
jgi:hypothetical protein